MNQANAPIRRADRFFIGGQWVTPSVSPKLRLLTHAQRAEFLRALGAELEKRSPPGDERLQDRPGPAGLMHRRSVSPSP